MIINFFISKHASEKHVKSLTCHAPGNFGKAMYGGQNSVLSCSNALVQTSALKHIMSACNVNYNVCFEVTHHGPCLNIPCLFLEVGGSEKEWKDVDACSVISEVVMQLIRKYNHIMKNDKKVCIGFGGPHYAPNFTKFVLNGKNIGHICPKYNLENLDKDMFKQMIDKTKPHPKKVIIDWKGTPSKNREKIINWAKELGLFIEKYH